jgi:hypothetical protein
MSSQLRRKTNLAILRLAKNLEIRKHGSLRSSLKMDLVASELANNS